MKSGSINNVAVIGTGMIGSSMAVLFTGNGYHTVMYAINDQEAAAGINRYEEYYRDLVEKKLVTDIQAKICRTYLSVTQNYADIADADFILECVVEKLEIKYAVYREIEKYCKNYKALASTTSAISADDLCKGLAAREKLMVAHPYNPPHLVPCIEIVKSQHTSAETVSIVESLFRSLGRAPVVMEKSAPGFVANRLQHALYREAVNIVEQGITTPEAVDEALKTSFAPRYTSIGIFEHFDYAGLDMIVNIEDYLFPDLCNADKTQDMIRRCFEKGNLGTKTGKGVYDWNGKDLEEFRRRAGEPYLKFFNWTLPEK
jgi:3-hydroxybutyryl-CoA dehydrogenase